MNENEQNELKGLCERMLTLLGEDGGREGLVRTPERFARAMADLTQGYHQRIEDIVNDAIFTEECSEMITVKRIEFYSMCEHHLLPFFGHAYVAYIPKGKVIGLSKIPRIVNMYARRLQIQERMTNQIMQTVHDLLQPEGVACMVEARHMCMMMRGIQVQSGSMVTNAMSGIFLENPATRDEFMKIVRS